jgi:hypothetical protein
MEFEKIKYSENFYFKEYDVVINLPDGMYKYNINEVTEEQIRNFILEKNKFFLKKLIILYYGK